MGFTFSTTQSIICETGICKSFGELIRTRGYKRVMIVTDPGIIKLGLAENALRSLKRNRIDFDIYDKVLPDPTSSIVTEAVAQGQQFAADVVVGFGGGSSMDVAKLVALLLVGTQSLDEIYGVNQVEGDRLPLVQVPTTAGTGSEVTPIAIVTTGASEKKGIVSPQLLPDLAVLDAELTVGLPPHITAATGIDAMVHAIEAFTSKIRKNPLSDMLAEKALRLLSGNIRTAVSEGGNLTARSDMLLGAMLAGQAFANAPVAAVHALAYPLGGHFHVPHGLSNSLVLPAVMRFNAVECNDLYQQLAPVIFPDLIGGEDVGSLIDRLEDLIEELGLETRLRDVGVSETDIDLLAADAMKQERLLVNNPREMTLSDARQIYQSVL